MIKGKRNRKRKFLAAVLAVTVLLTGIPMFTWAAQEPLED